MVLGNINPPSYVPGGEDSTAGVICDVESSISESDYPVLVKPVTEGLIVLHPRRPGNFLCVKIVSKGRLTI
ncbi:hypothetical protein HPB50_023173 [Hyalomma asiaticum]|uniref:Uncharacterized protein n=1 Tax=Hyalomma asiaticum TaxID=266040 RepID=A0ACB7T7L5_HYAAI|nr:hypothetical protein HPB50_023173 [Hyalomma asiaticum]